MPDKLRVGLIGANATYGWSPRAHLPALQALDDVDLVAVCTAHDAGLNRQSVQPLPCVAEDVIEALGRNLHGVASVFGE